MAISELFRDSLLRAKMIRDEAVTYSKTDPNQASQLYKISVDQLKGLKAFVEKDEIMEILKKKDNELDDKFNKKIQEINAKITSIDDEVNQAAQGNKDILDLLDNYTLSYLRHYFRVASKYSL